MCTVGLLITGKKCSKAPKIQRLVTPLTLQRKRSRVAEKKKRIAKAKADAAEYQKLLATRLKEQRDRRSQSLAKNPGSLLDPSLNCSLNFINLKFCSRLQWFWRIWLGLFSNFLVLFYSCQTLSDFVPIYMSLLFWTVLAWKLRMLLLLKETLIKVQVKELQPILLRMV